MQPRAAVTGVGMRAGMNSREERAWTMRQMPGRSHAFISAQRVWCDAPSTRTGRRQRRLHNGKKPDYSTGIVAASRLLCYDGIDRLYNHTDERSGLSCQGRSYGLPAAAIARRHCRPPDRVLFAYARCRHPGTRQTVPVLNRFGMHLKEPPVRHGQVDFLCWAAHCMLWAIRAKMRKTSAMGQPRRRPGGNMPDRPIGACAP